MAARGKQKLPAELSSAAARWAQWRRTRVLGTRIPESLWNSALELAARHGVSKTAIALGGDYYALRKRLDAQSPPRRVGATAAPAPAFVELTPPSPACRGSAELSELQAFQAAYEQQLNRQLFEPLLRWGEDASDPRERTQCAVAAEVCERFQRLAPLVAAELNAWAVHGELFIGNLRRGGGLQALMIMAKTLGKIVERRD